MFDLFEDRDASPSLWRRVSKCVETAVIVTAFSLWGGIALLSGGCLLGQLIYEIFG